jgi:hypothetical protein
MPTIKDEEDAYTAWGWDWSSAIHPGTVTESYSGTYNVISPDIHGDTEGDDLWTYAQMFDRGGNAVYENRRKEWNEYFEAGNYRLQLDSGTDDSYGYDHMYGYGLVYEYWRNGDAGALAEAVNLGAIVEDGWDGNGWNGNYGCLLSNACYEYGYREAARHLLLIAYLTKATGDSRWTTLRDTMVNTILNKSGWDATYGMFFAGEFFTDESFGSGYYAAGYRTYFSPAQAILVEGLYEVYLQTGNATIKSRIISMADFFIAKALDPSSQYVGYRAGINPSGNPYHIGPGAVYTTALVNTLVLAYKLTGTTNYLTQAKYFFNRGTKGDPGDGHRLAPDNKVHHFVDTVWASSTSYFYLDFNRGELLYTYRIFENGGSPTVVSTPPPPPPSAAPPSAPTGLRIQ